MYDTSQWVKDYDPKGKIKDIIRASNCRLECTDSIDEVTLQAGGEGIKGAIRRRMAYALGDAMLKKIKFTATDNPVSMTKQIRAHAYVFTDEEIMKLVEDILDAR